MARLSRLRNLWKKDGLDKNLNDELRAHLEMRANDSVASGMSPREARYDAQKRFGNSTLMKERTREMDLFAWVESVAPAGEVPPRRPGRTPVTSSFPSGHAAAAAAFATGVGLEMPALAAPVGALAVAVGVARVVNGVHYPSDIAGGWVVGVGVGMLTLRWWPLRRSERAAAARPGREAPAGRDSSW